MMGCGGGRIALAAVAMSLLSTVCSAQQGLRSASLPDRTPPPLPSSTPDLFLATPDTYAPRPPARRDLRHRFGDGYGLGQSVFGPVYGPGYGRYSDRRFARRAASGYLQLQVVPASAQVFVDGLYVGSVNDVRQMVPGVPLEPGAHRLELRAPGYELRSLELRMDPDETRIYRDDLNPIASAEPTPPHVAAGPPKTFYVIPGCYAGDKPPQTDRLRPGCSPSKIRTVPPVLSVVR